MTDRKGNTLLTNWKVHTKTALSDHKMITFDIDLGNKWETFSRKWPRYGCIRIQKCNSQEAGNRPLKAQLRLDNTRNPIQTPRQTSSTKFKQTLWTKYAPWSRWSTNPTQLGQRKLTLKNTERRKLKARSLKWFLVYSGAHYGFWFGKPSSKMQIRKMQIFIYDSFNQIIFQYI